MGIVGSHDLLLTSLRGPPLEYRGGGAGVFWEIDIFRSANNTCARDWNLLNQDTRSIVSFKHFKL